MGGLFATFNLRAGFRVKKVGVGGAGRLGGLLTIMFTNTVTMATFTNYNRSNSSSSSSSGSDSASNRLVSGRRVVGGTTTSNGING